MSGLVTLRASLAELDRQFNQVLRLREFASAANIVDGVERANLRIEALTARMAAISKVIEEREADETERNLAAQIETHAQEPREDTAAAEPPRKVMTIYGPKQSAADWYIYMLYDHYFGGPKVVIFTRADAVRVCEDFTRRGIKPVYGSRAGAPASDTGLGFLPTPTQLNAMMDDFTPDPTRAWMRERPDDGGMDSLGACAELDALDYLNTRGEAKPSDGEWQKKGVDIWFRPTPDAPWEGVQVKSRGEDKGKWETLFLQIEEDNTVNRSIR